MIQIRNKTTGLYDIRGHHGKACWTDKQHKRGTWGCIAHAKTHICQCIRGWGIYIDEVENYLDSEFVIVEGDIYAGNLNVKTEDVSGYIIEKLKEYLEYYNKYPNDYKEYREYCKETIEKYS